MKKIRTAWMILRTKGFGRTARISWMRFVLGVIYRLGRTIHLNTSQDARTRIIRDFTDQVNALAAPTVLELGSRNISRRGDFDAACQHVGFDINPGPGVDVVGDAHRLSQYFPREHFDAIYSVSVFEHLAMPWKSVIEANRVLKTGGLFLTITHPAYPPHALPWDFWRFSRSGFSALFNARTGFEIIDWAEGIPAVLLPLGDMEPHLRETHLNPCFLSIAVLARKIGDPDTSLNWEIDLKDIIPDTYPTTINGDGRDFVERLRGRGKALGDQL